MDEFSDMCYSTIQNRRESLPATGFPEGMPVSAAVLVAPRLTDLSPFSRNTSLPLCGQGKKYSPPPMTWRHNDWRGKGGGDDVPVLG